MKFYKSQILKSIFGLALFNMLACSAHEFQQLDEPLLGSLKAFNQSFDQLTQERMVDLLVVVDNSRSMRADQEKLGREFSNFVSGISDADYRIGVITTDTDSVGFENTPGYWGNLDRVAETGKNHISKSDANPSQLFSNLINRQETIDCTPTAPLELCASFDERPLYAIRQAIEKRNMQNSGFFRQGADLAVVIITDEDETPDLNLNLYAPSDLISFIDNEFSGEKRVLAFSIAIPEQDESCFNEQIEDTVSGASAVNYGVYVGRFADLTGGFRISICNQNFGADLSTISDYVQQELLPFHHILPETVLAESIKVTVHLLDGRVYESNFEVNGSQLSLVPGPPEGSTITISYDY